MRRLATLAGVVVALATACPAASAAPDKAADKLVKQGLALAKKEDYAAALAKFHAADDVEPRTEVACYIALTHGRMGQWGRAQLYYQRCTERASSGDPLPDWSKGLARTIDKALAKGDYAELSVIVEPPAGDARVTVSSFSGETLAAGQIFVPAGEVALSVSAAGYEPASTHITVKGGEKRVVELALEEVGAAPLIAHTDGNGPVDSGPTKSRRFMWAAFGSAGLFLAGGLVFHVAAAGTRGELSDAPDLDTYNDKKPSFEFQRTAAIACYGVAALSAAVGAYLYMKAKDEGDGGVSAAAATDGESAMAQVIWSF
ncbi:MAG TPA: hypothetical protein VFG83_12375 [Kofleriaceae bacterium]|nr:hypothetical protein [Kofleriaceae bacterium]